MPNYRYRVKHNLLCHESLKLGQRFPEDGHTIFLHLEEALRTAASVLFAKHADRFGDRLRVVLVDEVRRARDAYVLGSRDQRGEALVDTPLKSAN